MLENVFPPAPSDMIVVAIAIIIGVNGYPIIPVIIACTIGSTLGFWIMFALGKKFEHSIIDSNKIKFLSRSAIEKVEVMFRKWGFKLVAINRFMSGTRAVISFFAGMSDLPLQKTMSLAAVSSFLWYAILSVAGNYFGKDWRELVTYLQIYEQIVILVVIAIAIVALGIWLLRRFVFKKKVEVEK
ncbi:MAG: DedA family protein [Ignavibacteria bacterium]|nr:DedA family protein [Ignavibacteria bacterium]